MSPFRHKYLLFLYVKGQGSWDFKWYGGVTIIRPWQSRVQAPWSGGWRSGNVWPIRGCRLWSSSAHRVQYLVNCSSVAYAFNSMWGLNQHGSWNIMTGRGRRGSRGWSGVSPVVSAAKEQGDNFRCGGVQKGPQIGWAISWRFSSLYHIRVDTYSVGARLGIHTSLISKAGIHYDWNLVCGQLSPYSPLAGFIDGILEPELLCPLFRNGGASCVAIATEK